MDRESALETLKKEGYKLRDMPQYMNDKELVLAAVRDYGLSLKDASPSLRADRQIVMAAVKNNGMAIDHASPELQKDKVIMKAANDQEQALDDKMKKQYFKKPKSKKAKGGRRRKTRKMRGGLRNDLLDKLYLLMATEMQKPEFSMHVRVKPELLNREIRLLAAARIHMLPYNDALTTKKNAVIKYILDEQFKESDGKIYVTPQDVNDKAAAARLTTYYPFFNKFSDAEIMELINQVSEQLEH